VEVPAAHPQPVLRRAGRGRVRRAAVALPVAVARVVLDPAEVVRVEGSPAEAVHPEDEAGLAEREAARPARSST
jgi:hypothetical protein